MRVGGREGEGVTICKVVGISVGGLVGWVGEGVGGDVGGLVGDGDGGDVGGLVGDGVGGGVGAGVGAIVEVTGKILGISPENR